MLGQLEGLNLIVNLVEKGRLTILRTIPMQIDQTIDDLNMDERAPEEAAQLRIAQGYVRAYMDGDDIQDLDSTHVCHLDDEGEDEPDDLEDHNYACVLAECFSVMKIVRKVEDASDDLDFKEEAPESVVALSQSLDFLICHHSAESVGRAKAQEVIEGLMASAAVHGQAVN